MKYQIRRSYSNGNPSRHYGGLTLDAQSYRKRNRPKSILPFQKSMNNIEMTAIGDSAHMIPDLSTIRLFLWERENFPFPSLLHLLVVRIIWVGSFLNLEEDVTAGNIPRRFSRSLHAHRCQFANAVEDRVSCVLLSLNKLDTLNGPIDEHGESSSSSAFVERFVRYMES